MDEKSSLECLLDQLESKKLSISTETLGHVEDYIQLLRLEGVDCKIYRTRVRNLKRQHQRQIEVELDNLPEGGGGGGGGVGHPVDVLVPQTRDDLIRHAKNITEKDTVL